MFPPPEALMVWVPPVGIDLIPLAVVDALVGAELTRPEIVIASPDVAPELMLELIPETPSTFR